MDCISSNANPSAGNPPRKIKVLQYNTGTGENRILPVGKDVSSLGIFRDPSRELDRAANAVINTQSASDFNHIELSVASRFLRATKQ